MPRTVTERALEFNKDFLRSMAGIGDDGNTGHLQLAKKALLDAVELDLTPRQRQLVTMYYFEERTLPQIAQELSLDTSTVCRTLQRARKRLQKSMRVYFDYVHFQLGV